MREVEGDLDLTRELSLASEDIGIVECIAPWGYGVLRVLTVFDLSQTQNGILAFYIVLLVFVVCEVK